MTHKYRNLKKKQCAPTKRLRRGLCDYVTSFAAPLHMNLVGKKGRRGPLASVLNAPWGLGCDARVKNYDVGRLTVVQILKLFKG